MTKTINVVVTLIVVILMLFVQHDVLSSEAKRINIVVGDVNFNMRYAPASNFPLGFEDQEVGEVKGDFWIAETEVTYELWIEVLDWATANGYNIWWPPGHKDAAYLSSSTSEKGEWHGRPVGTVMHPVTTVPYYSVMAWCNALTEFYNAEYGTDFEPVYYNSNGIIRDTSVIVGPDDTSDITFIMNATGFRLPVLEEWELAARYRGNDFQEGTLEYPEGSGVYWTPHNWVSGADGPLTDKTATMNAGWFVENAFGQLKEVGQKPIEGNHLGLYDMSGNVEEYWLELRDTGYRIVSGGGSIVFSPNGVGTGPTGGDSSSRDIGFRLVRTVQDDLPKQTINKWERERSFRMVVEDLLYELSTLVKLLFDTD